MRKPKISVVVPAYNVQAVIGKCLRALERQTLKPEEIIVVDDGSTDQTRKILSEFQVSNSKFRILKQSHQGTAKARNLGVQKAKGEIVAFTDSDCVPPKDWLKKIAIALSDSDIGAVGGGYNSGINNTFWQRFFNEELFFRRQKRDGLVTTLVSNNMACRKQVFLAERGFPEQYPVCEDMLLSYRISRKHKVLWLKDNGVMHHFKNSLKEFLKHQYFFGKESTRFFLENPKLLFSDHHQSKRLHFAIIVSFLSLIILLTALVFLILGNSVRGRGLLGVFAFLLLIHLVSYSDFIFHLYQTGFSNLNITRAYFVSHLRDLICGPAFLAGFIAFLTRQKA